MKNQEEISAWLKKELSYDASGEKECAACGRGGYNYWIDHRSALVGNLLVFLELAPKHTFAHGAIYDAIDTVFEHAFVTGSAERDAPMLAGEVMEALGWQ